MRWSLKGDSKRSPPGRENTSTIVHPPMPPPPSSSSSQQPAGASPAPSSSTTSAAGTSKAKSHLASIKAQLDDLSKRLSPHTHEPEQGHPHYEKNNHGGEIGGVSNRADGAGSDSDTLPIAESAPTLLHSWWLQLEILQRRDGHLVLFSPGSSIKCGSVKGGAETSTLITIDPPSMLAWLLEKGVNEVAGRPLLVDMPEQGGSLLGSSSTFSSSTGLPAAATLAAAASILQGRISEQLFLLLEVAPKGEKQQMATLAKGQCHRSFDPMLLAQAAKRCAEVNDDRLGAFVQLIKRFQDRDGDNQESGNGTSAAYYSYVAEGCYGRAARLSSLGAGSGGGLGSSSNSNPQFYKAAWDAVRLRREHEKKRGRGHQPSQPPPLLPNLPVWTSDSSSNRKAASVGPLGEEDNDASWEALDWILALHRIASAKRNVKRAADLSLVLLENCLVDGPASSESFAAWASSSSAAAAITMPQSPLPLLNAIQQTFVAPVRSISPPAAESLLKVCEDHLNRLQLDHPLEEELTSPYKLRMRFLRFLLVWRRREHAIALDGQARHQSARNRHGTSSPRYGTSSSAPPLSLERCLEQARIDYMQRMSDDGDYVSSWLALAADPLLDALREDTARRSSPPSTPGGENRDDDYESQECVARVRGYVSAFLTGWHADYLKAKMLLRRESQQLPSPSVWGWTRRTVAALLQEWQEEEEVLSHAGHGRLTSTASEDFLPDPWVVGLAAVVPTLEWMCSSSPSMGGCLFSTETLQLAQKVLKSVIQATSPMPVSRSLLPDETAVLSPLSQARQVRPDEYAFVRSANRSLLAILYIAHPHLSGTGPMDDLLARRSAEIAQSAAGQQGIADGLQDDNEGLLGTSYYEFLVAWSGLSTATPWPHCVSAEARAVVERARKACNWAERNWGRPTARVELWLLKLALADAEVGTGVLSQPTVSSSGSGLSGRAQTLYLQLLSEISDGDSFVGNTTLLYLLLRSKCYSGIASIALRLGLSGWERVSRALQEHGIKTPEELSRRNLELLLPALGESSHSKEESWYLGVSPEARQRALRVQIALVRHQIASCFLRVGRFAEAESFLEDAFKSCTNDPGAAFALGAFRLRLVFFHSDNPLPSAVTDAARDQLLTTAKLDPSRASPFALLGYLFEFTKDEKRAVGCYSKALLLDPSHPVAGRGLLRLRPSESLLDLLQRATDNGSSLGGWAWRALGVHKAMKDSNDDHAVVSLLQALRCTDIRNPNADELSIFYASPFSPKEPGYWEFLGASADLAACYRRLGRFTASLRSYYKALEMAGDESASSSIATACAQVEVELGLFDEASEKLTFVMKVSDDPAVRSLSAYCLGICLLSMAKRDSQDGKAGAAFLHLQQGIDSCRQLGRHLGCVHKLLGDLYSFGAVLPLDIFSEDTVYVPDERNVVQEELMVRRQLAFVAEGKISYEAAETLLRGSDEEELLVMRASAATDVGSNLLLQAQIVSFWQNKGIDEVAPPEAEHLLEQAEREFRRAIGICPVYAPAWCGLGCAVHKFDPILAQHAFCRSIQLDPLFPDPYASLGFLYTRCGAAQASTSVSMALTQVADTPMMWINRALLLERQEGSLESARAPSIPGGSAHRYEQAADAYRAALQVAPLPSAKLGLALTCRRRRQQQQLLPQPLPRSWSPASINDDPISRAESHCLLREYLDATGRLDVASRVFGGVAACESGSAPALGGTSSSSSATISDRLLDEGRREILVGLDRLEGFSVEDEERDGDLNLESIRTLLSRYPAVPSETSAPFAEATTTTAAAAAAAAKIGFDPNVGLAKRRVYLEPERGDLWLALANDLVRSLPVSWDPAAADSAGREEEEKDATALRDARVAAHRACDLLEGRSRDPSLRRDPRHPHRGPSPSAREVSEALALRCWLDSVAAATATGLPSGSKGGRFRITVDAQRALLLCPDNAVAREILMAQQGISS